MKTARVLPKAPQIRSDTRPPSFRRSSQLGVFSRLPIILPIQPFKLAQDLDYRATTNGLLGREFVAYDNAIRRIINPRHRDKTGLYSCAGADISNFLLSTDATVAYFVDLASPRVSELQRILTQEWDRPETSEDYAPYKFRRGYARALSLGMDYIEPKIITELKCLGVERYRPDGSQNINFAENPDGRVTISFDWAYGSQQAKTYSITYIKADMTKPEDYPEPLCQVLSAGIDIYYERAALGVPLKRKDFLFTIIASIRDGGFIVTDETSSFGTNPSLENMTTGLIRVPSEELAELALNPAATGDNQGYGWRSQVHQKLQA